MGFLISPFISPFAFGFLVARAEFVSPFLDTHFSDSGTYFSWRWTYGIGSMYSGFVLFLIVCFGRET